MSRQMSTTQPVGPDVGSTAPLSERRAAVVAGLALAAMALLAPVVVFVVLPADAFGLAAAGILVIAVLDVVVGAALYPVLVGGGRWLAATAAGLRIGYAAAFAAAAVLLVVDADPDRFQALWDRSLLVFGLHLVCVGAALVRGPRTPTWLGMLVAVAGIGYVLDAVLVIADATPDFSFAEVTFLGEIVLLVWLLVRGGRQPSGRDAGDFVGDAPVG